MDHCVEGGFNIEALKRRKEDTKEITNTHTRFMGHRVEGGLRVQYFFERTS